MRKTILGVVGESLLSLAQRCADADGATAPTRRSTHLRISLFADPRDSSTPSGPCRPRRDSTCASRRRVPWRPRPRGRDKLTSSVRRARLLDRLRARGNGRSRQAYTSTNGLAYRGRVRCRTSSRPVGVDGRRQLSQSAACRRRHARRIRGQRRAQRTLQALPAPQRISTRAASSHPAASGDDPVRTRTAVGGSPTVTRSPENGILAFTHVDDLPADRPPNLNSLVPLHVSPTRDVRSTRWATQGSAEGGTSRRHRAFSWRGTAAVDGRASSSRSTTDRSSTRAAGIEPDRRDAEGAVGWNFEVTSPQPGRRRRRAAVALNARHRSLAGG